MKTRIPNKEIKIVVLITFWEYIKTHLISNKKYLDVFSNEAAFRPTGIGNLAFAHKGFTFNSFSIVFSVLTFQGIVFLESLRKR